MELRGKNQLKAEPVHAKQTGCLGNYECALSAWMAPAATIFHEAFLSFQFLITGFFFFVDQIFQNVNHLAKISNTVWQHFDPRYSPPPLFCLKNWAEFVGIPLALYEKKILQTVLDPFPHCVTNTFFILTELKKYKKEQKAFFLFTSAFWDPQICAVCPVTHFLHIAL